MNTPRSLPSQYGCCDSCFKQMYDPSQIRMSLAGDFLFLSGLFGETKVYPNQAIQTRLCEQGLFHPRG